MIIVDDGWIRIIQGDDEYCVPLLDFRAQLFKEQEAFDMAFKRNPCAVCEQGPDSRLCLECPNLKYRRRLSSEYK